MISVVLQLKPSTRLPSFSPLSSSPVYSLQSFFFFFFFWLLFYLFLYLRLRLAKVNVNLFTSNESSETESPSCLLEFNSTYYAFYHFMV